MKYDDAEHIMATLEKAYPNAYVDVQSHPTYSEETHEYTGPRSYNVTAKFPHGIELDNMQPLIELQATLEGISAMFLNGSGHEPLRVLFTSTPTILGNTLTKGP